MAMHHPLRIERADLYADWVAIARGRLLRAGFDVQNLLTDDAISLEYFNALLHLTIAARPRRLFKAANFTCPPDLLAGLRHFEARTLAGESLRPYMSRGAKKVANRDLLRYDWGIHHFHLGASFEADGFVSRTGPLLFAFVKPDELYLLAILSHGTWSEQKLLQLTHENWPHLLAPYRTQLNVLALGHEHTDAEIARLRKSQVNTILRVADGVFIHPPGGGFATSGHSEAVAENHLILYRSLTRLSQAIHNLSAEAVTKPWQLGLLQVPDLAYSLVDLGGSHFGLDETANQVRMLLDGPSDLPSL
jgi:hypothetical protein